MRFGRFFWKLFLGNAALLVLALGISVWLIVAEFDRFHAQELDPYLFNHAETVLALVQEHFDSAHREDLDTAAKRIGSSHPEGIRVTFIAADGTVLGDSQASPADMVTHGDRPEVREALRTGRGAATRWSSTVARTLKYVAVRVGPAGTPKGVVRVAMTVHTLGERARIVRGLLGPIGMIALLASVGLAAGLAVTWSGRIRRLTGAAQGLSRGDLSRPVTVSGTDEVAILAKSLDRMRHRLTSQLATIDRQRRTLESLIGQLNDAVVVADRRGRIILFNRAAVRFFSLPAHIAGGFVADSRLTVERCIAQHDLQRLLLASEAPDALSGVEKPASEVRLDLETASGPAHVLARVTDIAVSYAVETGRLADAAESLGSGRLLVVADITELTRAVRSRSDFVANASHELRTPLSAIRVAVETLMKMDMADESAAAGRFLDVISRHTARLESLISDLLDLSRLESPGARFEPAALYLQRVVDELYHRWDDAIQKKGLRWRAEVSADCPMVWANAHLLELALDNLVDNAIKFSDAGGEVAVRCLCDSDHAVIEISDTGCGIPEADQERVFERFYQVNPARSGTASGAHPERGTGLGLAIVRHAVAAIGGKVGLSSVVGSGTSVQIRLLFSRSSTPTQ